MPPAIFKRVREQAYSDFADILAQLNFLGATLKVVAASGRIAEFAAPDADLRPVVESFRRNKVDDFNSFHQGLFVQVCSTYEAFVSSLIRDFIAQAVTKYKSYDNLKARGSLLDHHTYHTGVALQQIFDNRTNKALDFELLAKNLASVTPNNQAVTLNTEVFTLLLGALKPDGLQHALKRIGIKHDENWLWDAIGNEDDLRAFFGEKKSRATGVAARAHLTRFVLRRNMIVHRGDRIEPISENDVREAITYFKILVRALSDILASEI